MNKRTIRNAVGLPDDNGKILGVVSDDPAEVCENTIGYARSRKAKSPHTANSEASRFDFGASGGSTSPNTEVNADGQGRTSEVKTKNR